MSDQPARGFIAYEQRDADALRALREEDVRALDAKNADAFASNAVLFQAAQQIAEDIDPTNREIRALAPPTPPALLNAWLDTRSGD